MNNSSYIVIMSWMMTKLGLSGNELLCYAMIHGYSQGGKGGYYGSLSHTAEALNVSKRSAVNILQKLVDKGYLEKKNFTLDGVERCMYRTVAADDEAEKPPKAKPVVQQPPQKCEKPTVDEVREYCRQRGNNVDPQRFVDFYTANGWVQGRGKPIKDWRAAVRTWERNDNEKHQQHHGERTDKESVLARRRDDICREIADIDAAYNQAKARDGDAERVLGSAQSGHWDEPH